MTQTNERLVDDAVCLGCGCTCDDIRLRIQGERLVAAEKACSLGLAWFGNGVVPSQALEDGTASTPERAVEAMARILTDARSPLVYLAPDITCETQRQAVAVADLLRATLDSVTSGTAVASILAAQQRGRAGATLGEIRNRADVVLFWGVDPAARYPRFQERYAPDPEGVHVPGGRRSRTVIAVDVGDQRGPADADVRVSVAPGDEVAALVRIAASLSSSAAADSTEALDALAMRLRQGRYVVVIADAEGHEGGQAADRLRADALVTLSQALNAPTRGAVSLLRGGGNRAGADAVSTWQTGFPLGIDFSRGYPRFAPWNGTAESRLSRGEIDAILVVGNASILPAALMASVTALPGRVTTCVIGPHASSSAFSKGAAVVDTGLPGLHAAGTVLRMDDVPLPVRATFRGEIDAEVITRALCERIVAVQRDARLDTPARISR